MKNLDLLPLSAESKKRIDEFAKQYQRYGHISIEVVSYSDGRLIRLATWMWKEVVRLWRLGRVI